jgi:hypothetical protein
VVLDGEYLAAHNQLHAHRRGKVINEIHLFHHRLKIGGIENRALREVEIWIVPQMSDVRQRPRAQVIDDEDLLALRHQSLRQMRTDEASPAGD